MNGYKEAIAIFIAAGLILQFESTAGIMEKQAAFVLENIQESSMDRETTVQIYIKYFTTLKYFGLFPFKTIFKPIKDGKGRIDGHDRSVSRLRRLSTGGWWWLSVGVLVFVWAHCTFEIYQIDRKSVV